MMISGSTTRYKYALEFSENKKEKP